MREKGEMKKGRTGEINKWKDGRNRKKDELKKGRARGINETKKERKTMEEARGTKRTHFVAGGHPGDELLRNGEHLP
jgi:hypothetical protein